MAAARTTPVSAAPRAPIAPGSINGLSDRGAMGLPEHYTSGPIEDLGPMIEDLRSLPIASLARITEDPRVPLQGRLAAGTLLGLLGDPRTPVDAPQMVDIPGDTVTAWRRRMSRPGIAISASKNLVVA